MTEHPDDNPMNHPPEQPSGTDGMPKFGRLLLVLLSVVALLAVLTYVMQAIYS